jgi:hypothetical protein
MESARLHLIRTSVYNDSDSFQAPEATVSTGRLSVIFFAVAIKRPTRVKHWAYIRASKSPLKLSDLYG